MHANEVIRVHDRVDETVEHNGQVDVSVVVENRVEPVEEEDCRVVVDVQERELGPLLARNDEELIRVGCGGVVDEGWWMNGGQYIYLKYTAPQHITPHHTIHHTTPQCTLHQTQTPAPTAMATGTGTAARTHRVHKVEDFGDVEEPEHLGHRGLLTVDEVSTHHRVAL